MLEPTPAPGEDHGTGMDGVIGILMEVPGNTLFTWSPTAENTSNTMASERITHAGIKVTMGILGVDSTTLAVHSRLAFQ